jgi:hypothetical protein
MDIPLVDIMIHMDESLAAEKRSSVEGLLRDIDGVVSVHNPDDKPHLTVVGYRPDKTSSEALLQCVRAEGIHAQIVGL